jgi:hypothetical protein
VTVSTQDSKIQYFGDGSNVNFTVPYPLLDETHLDVYLTDRGDDTETAQVLTTDYTVEIESDNQSATVTFNTAPTSTDLVTIIRTVPITQLVDYIQNDPFPAETNEQALDKLTMICQQLEELFNRCTTLAITSTSSQPTITTGSGVAGVTNVFPAKLAAPTNGVSTFAEQEPLAAGGWQALSGGLTGSARAMNGCLDSYVDKFVFMMAIEDEDSNVEYRFEPPGDCTA